LTTFVFGSNCMIHYMTADGLGAPWVGNELRIVGEARIPFVLHSMRLPAKTNFGSSWATAIATSMRKPLYPIPPLEMLIAVLCAPFVLGTRFFAGLFNALFGEREMFRSRIACLSHFFVACMWAMRLRKEQKVSHIHAQWAFSSGSIAMYGAWLLGVPFSFTGHAVDLTRQRVALRDKIRRAKFIIAISEWHKQFYLAVERGEKPWEQSHPLYEGGPEAGGPVRADQQHIADKIHIAYCGIYTDEMKPPSAESRASMQSQPFTILSAGRLIGKKGFPVLLDAIKILKDRNLHTQSWATGRPAGIRCILAGSGPDEAVLREKIASLGIGDIVTMTGQALQQEKIPAYMHGGDVFVLACVWAEDGDVDGLPQLTMEAMGCGVPAITTRLVGNPDLVVHDDTGLLVKPGSASELADALERMMREPATRERFAQAGRERVLRVFDIRQSLNPLLERYTIALSSSRA
jgi:glycosyltransferase involved in cell wall biosynthesis